MLSSRIVRFDAAGNQTGLSPGRFHQGQGVRRARRYPSGTTDARWVVIDPPDPVWLSGTVGGDLLRREISGRDLLRRRQRQQVATLPVDFPPWSTVYNYFAGEVARSTKTCWGFAIASGLAEGRITRTRPLVVGVVEMDFVAG